MYTNFQKKEFNYHSPFTVSKEWFYILPFFLLPFCAFPNVLLNKLQFQDLSRIYFFFFGVLSLLVFRKDAVKKFKITLVIAFVFLTCNWISNIVASFKFDINGIVSSIKLAVDFFAFILIPLCGIQYTIDKISPRRFNQFYLIPVAIVIVISLIQILLMFGMKNGITDYYTSGIFKYIEGSWDGVPITLSNALREFRVKSTFHEPSVLASFLLLYTFPFMLCRYLNGVYSFNRIVDFLFLTLPFGCLLFSFSTTSYIVASIDLVIILFLSLQNKLSIKHFIVILLIIAGSIYLIVSYYETYSRIVSRVFMYKTDTSSSTRIGSIVGAIHLFEDNPLGVGYTNEKYLVYDYLPDWGRTVEATRERSNVQSFYLRILGGLGIPWVIFCFGVLISIWLAYRRNKNYLLQWQKDALLLWIINLLICISFGAIEYHNQWFLLSALIMVGPVFKNYRNKEYLKFTQICQQKKVL
jgi:O-antigen ligase